MPQAITSKPRKPKHTFDPAARLMVLLGDQLIRSPNLAVFELVKNAYDADATECLIEMRDIDGPDGTIVITDNGVGMTLDRIEDVWLRPGTRTRLNQREDKDKKTRRSLKYKRLPLGEKGVGRFAVHKLGNNIELVTRAKNSKEVIVEIDWTTFDNDHPLSKIPVKVIEREPEVFKGKNFGTQITVSNLRDGAWTRGEARKLHRSVTSICSPSKAPASFSAELHFEPEPEDWVTGLLDSERVRELALFVCRGTIGSGGVAYEYEFKPTESMKKQGVRARQNDMTVPLKPPRKRDQFREELPLFEQDGTNLDIPRVWSSLGIGEISFEFLIFELKPKTLRALETNPKSLKDYLNNNGGVRVYRDGIRVYDFGEPDNDWLSLDAKRINVPVKRIGNNQMLGEVRISLESSGGLIEKTNREGFVENKAYQLFRWAVESAVTQAAAERNIDKEQIRISENAEITKTDRPVIADLSRLKEAVKETSLSEADQEKLLRYVNQIDQQFRETQGRLLTAASSGLSLSLVIHQVEKSIETLYRDIKRDESSHDVILQAAKFLKDQVESITWLIRRGRPSKLKVSALCDQVQLVWGSRFEHHGIEFINELNGRDHDFEITCTRRMIVAAFMNLIDNSIYWLSSQNQGRKIWIGSSFDLGEGPAIVVADNGPGLTDDAEYLTLPYFTRKPDGMGLGLHLADEIMNAHNGSLQFPEFGEVKLPPGLNGAVVAMLFTEPKK